MCHDVAWLVGVDLMTVRHPLLQYSSLRTCKGCTTLCTVLIIEGGRRDRRKIRNEFGVTFGFRLQTRVQRPSRNLIRSSAAHLVLCYRNEGASDVSLIMEGPMKNDTLC